jgi:hypothetical protein
MRASCVNLYTRMQPILGYRKQPRIAHAVEPRAIGLQFAQDPRAPERGYLRSVYPRSIDGEIYVCPSFGPASGSRTKQHSEFYAADGSQRLRDLVC